MRRTGNIGLIAAALLAVASAPPEHASAQVPDPFDVRHSGFAPASPSLDTRSVLTTASTGWVAPHGMSASFVGCPRSSPYMFGSNPGMFRYGWYMSPFDVRFSRAWFRPVSPWYPWFTGWGSRPGFGYGSYWRGAGPGAWGPWPGSSGMCGPGSSSSAFFFGAGGFGYGGYPGFGGGYGYGGYRGFGSGYGYSGYPGFGGFGSSGAYGGGFGGSYGGYSGYRGFSGLSGDSSAYPGGSGFDSSEWGHIPESLRNMKGFRVIESRPTTVGADLRRTDPSHLDRWFEQFGPEGERVRASTPTTRDPVADAQARGQATERASRESISDKIARARSAERAGSASPRSAPDRSTPSARSPARSAPSRTAAPSSKPARATPRSSSRPSASSSARSAPRSSPRPAPKSSSKKSSRSSGKTPQ